jgi:hypothetical protein
MWGWAVSGFDARNSSITGTTYSGPNGSGQFLAVQASTATAMVVNIYGSTASGAKIMGILQNKPSTGMVANVGVAGFSKAVAGASIDPGQEVMASSTAVGTLVAFSSGAGAYAVGRNVGVAATVGQVFSAYLYGTGGNLA